MSLLSPQAQPRSASPGIWDSEEKHRSENMPLVETVAAPQPPTNGHEIDDLDGGNVQVPTNPYPDMDDTFYGNVKHPLDEHIPDFASRAGFEDDIPDSKTNHNGPSIPGSSLADRPHFPYAPGYGPHSFRPDTEFGGIPTDLESIPDVNVYQHKKTLAQGMMDIALFSANANQLRYVIETTRRHPYYYPSIILISISLLLQIAIGVGLIWNSRYNVKDKKEICIANKVNNYTVVGIFIVTSVNVFISAFGVATPVSAAT